MASEEQKNRTMKEQNAILANSSVALDKEVRKQEKEREKLSGDIESLTKKLADITTQIDTKNNERREDLNKRDIALIAKEDQLDAALAQAETDENNLMNRASYLNASVAKTNRLNEDTEQLNFDLAAKLKDHDVKSKKLDAAIKEQSESLVSRTDLDNKLQVQISDYKYKAKEAEIALEANKTTASELSAIRADLVLRQASTDENLVASKKQLDENKGLEQVLRGKVKSAKESESTYDNKLNGFERREKELELGWLKIGKLIQDENIDVQLEALKNG